MPLTEEVIRETLKQVIDPELFVNIIDLGLIYNVTVAPAAEAACCGETNAAQPVTSSEPAVASSNRAAPHQHDGSCGTHQSTAAETAQHECSSQTAADIAVAKSSGAANQTAASTAADSILPLAGGCCGGAGEAAAAQREDIFVDMTMTSPACPAGPQLIANTKQVLGRLEGVNKVEVRIVMVPPWTPDKMTEAARDQLGIF